MEDVVYSCIWRDVLVCWHPCNWCCLFRLCTE